VAASLLAFIVVYFALFGAGTYYILKMMNKTPGDLAKLPGTVTRTAGTTPATSLDPDAMNPIK
jgi:cytochrome d ubiquinol oxidase subunit I